MMEIGRRSCMSGEYIELELRPSTNAPTRAECGIELEDFDSDKLRFFRAQQLLPSHHDPRVITNDLQGAEEEAEHEEALREDSSFGSQQSSNSNSYYNYYWGSSNGSEEKLDRWSSSSRCSNGSSLDSLPNKASSCFHGPSPPRAKVSGKEKKQKKKKKKKKKGWWEWKALINKLFWGLESPAPEPGPPSLVVEPKHHVPDVFGTYQPTHLPVEKPSSSTLTHIFGAVQPITPGQYHKGPQSSGDSYIWHRCFAKPMALYGNNNNNNKSKSNNNNNNKSNNNNNNNNKSNNNNNNSSNNNNNKSSNNHNHNNNNNKSKSLSSTPLAKSPIREHYYAHQAGGPGYTYLAAKYRHLACTSSCPGSVISSPVHHQYSGSIPTSSSSSHIAIQGAIDHCKQSQCEHA